MAEEKKGASVVGEMQVSDQVVSFRKQSDSSSNTQQAKVVEGSYSSEIESNPQILIIPFARALAKKMNIDITKVRGTGPNGQILIADIENASAQSSQPSRVENMATQQSQTPLFITPLALEIAKENNVDISSIKGSGYQGRIYSSDVSSEIGKATVHAPTPTPSSTPTPLVSPELVRADRREKVSSIRKAIAKNMKNSWSSVAYTNLVLEIDMTKLWNLRNEIKDIVLNTTGVKITFLPYIVKALNIALVEFPLVNSSYDEQTEEMVFKGAINMGIAVDTPAGLMVPVIKNSDTKNILTIAKEINELAKLARDKKLKGSDMANGTFTITNYGSVGALYGVPVINYPQLAIAGVGAIVDRVYFKDKEFVNGKVMHITVAADHRWIDGAEIGRFASRVKSLLENPEILGLY